MTNRRWPIRLCRRATWPRNCAAIGINDKFLMIRDLFDGDARAYEAALDKLDAFGDFDDCMIYIAENYAWNANSDGAKFLMELLERKFA